MFLHRKSTSSLTSFLRYCKDFANLLFWVVCAGPVMSTKINDINLQDSLMFILMQKIYFTLPLFYEILQRYYKFATLLLSACLAMNTKNDNASFQETLTFIFMQKIIYIPPLFPQLLQRYCKLVIFVLWECQATPTKGNSRDITL